MANNSINLAKHVDTKAVTYDGQWQIIMAANTQKSYIKEVGF